MYTKFDYPTHSISISHRKTIGSAEGESLNNNVCRTKSRLTNITNINATQ